MKRMTSAVLVAGGMLCAHASFGQNTNAPRFLKTAKAGADIPVVLDWASDPLTMYRVEYSTTLSNDWKLAQDNFPPQGTNTVWSDTGSESALALRFSSGDPLSPYRFYRLRVERYMSNTSPVTVTINNVSGGATLSGLIDVQASAIASQGITSGKLYVDGEMVEVSSGTSYTLPLETRLFPNGTHRLSVVAQDAGGSESTEETNPATDLGATYGSKNVTATFNNDLSNVRLRHKAFRPDLGHTQLHLSSALAC